MERLTKRTETGMAYLVKVKQNEQKIEGTKNTLECVLDSWQRLAAYEDTGLTPEAIKNHIPKALSVAKSLKWILSNIEDCGPNTFEHAIHVYIGEAIQILEGAEK